ncbi:MAG: PAS domain S-box protein, partial [Thiohalomonadales bacterium]
MIHFRDLPIRNKVVMLVMAVSLIIVASIGGARLVWDMGHAKQALLQEISALTNLLANRSNAALAFDDKRLAQENLLSLQEIPHVVLACLYRKDGTHFAKYHRDLSQVSCPVSGQVNSLQQRFDADHLHTVAPVRQGDSLLGWIYISTDLGSIEKRFHNQLLFSGITLAFAALLAGLLAVWVQRLISGPVEKVTAVANAIERRGDFSLRAQVSGNDEVGQLARGFNSMLEALQIQSDELATTKAEQEALLSKYRSLFEHFGDAILLADVETGAILDVNPAAIERYGYSREEFLSMTIFDMSSKDNLADVSHFIRQIGHSGHGIFEREHLTKDGREIPGEVSTRVIELNGRPVFLNVIRDLSERRLAEQALGESEGRFRSLLEQSPFGMQIMSPDGRVRLVNPAWERFWGVSLDGLSNYNILSDQNLMDKGVMPYIERGFSGEVTEIPPIPYNAKDTPGVVSRVITPDRW